MWLKLHRLATHFAEVLAGLAVSGLLLLAILTGVDVLMRYLFNAPIRGMTDFSMVAAAVLLSACMPHVVASRANIMVSFVGRVLGPTAFRALNFFGALVTCVFFAFMAWQCTRYAISMYQGGETLPTLRWPVWPWWSGVAVFISLTALVALATLTEPPSESKPARND